MVTRPGARTSATVWSIERQHGRYRADDLATEEPMEIRVISRRGRQTAAVTMRTPGNDFELAVGFLFSEGVIQSRDDIAQVSYCIDPDIDAAQQYNIVNVALRHDVMVDLTPLERHFSITSACGVCGKATLDALQLRGCPAIPAGPEVSVDVLYGLPTLLQAAQGVFRKTGGLHAAALFTPNGTLVAAREDVGRHNALDKLIGWALLEGKLPLHDRVVVVSGRASFEILQKSIVAGIPIICSISAPSSLAVDLAREFGVTLVGFLRDERCNVYAGKERIALDQS